MPNIKTLPFCLFLFLVGFQGVSQSLPISIDSLQAVEKITYLIENGLIDSLDHYRQYEKFMPDSIQAMMNESIEMDSLANNTRNDVETTVNYQAKDSIFFDLTNQKMYLYGDAKIDYGNISLTGATIEMDWIDNTLYADHTKDSTGRKVGKPVFTQAGSTYETNNMTYNFKTKKAFISGIITQRDGGFIHGERVKKNEADEMFIQDGKYTTCDLETPHFFIKSNKLKVIPNDRVLSGFFRLHFGEIPMPIGFPFGMFPSPRKKASGIIFPSYGEENSRGFFVRNGGYYFDINEFMDLKLTGDLYTNGSYGLQAQTSYKVRYKYGGSFSVRYNRTNSVEFEDDSFGKDVWVNWSHTPTSFGTSRFSASVSAGTSTYTANANNVASDFTQSTSAQFSSSISYSKTFKGTPFNMTANARYSQNVSTKIGLMTLPDLSFNMSRIQPFKKVNSLKNGVLGKLGFTYQLTAKAELSNTPTTIPSYAVGYDDTTTDEVLEFFNADNFSTLLSQAEYGARHRIPISTSFNVLKHFTVSPSFNYTEVWYPNELSYTYNAAEEAIEIDTLNRFSRAGWWSSGASVSTRLYGMYSFRSEKVKAIRHVLTPNVGFSYSPDFGSVERGTYAEVQTDEDGNTRTLSKYNGFIYGGPTQGESASLSFSLNNNLEMKVKSKSDSTDEFKKIKLFDNLSLSSSYDFLKDSFNLSNINWNARTSFFKGAAYVSLSGTIDPYYYVLDSVEETSTSEIVHQRVINRFAWENGQGIGHLTRMSVSVGLNLKPKGSRDNSNGQPDPAAGDPFGQQNGLTNEDEKFQAGSVDDFISYDPNQYVPFDVPWTLNVNYSINYNRDPFEKADITQTLNFNGTLNITNKTKIGFNSGFDLEAKDFTVTRINATRDLHCWNISFNWVPFGVRQSYYVKIAVNSHILKDLKLDRRNRSTYTSF